MTDRAAFERMIGELRPKLHRYCARMAGSVIDGEDVLQEAIIKALEAFGDDVGNPEAWLFRIAHNAALDHLRRKARQEAGRSDEDLDMIADASEADRRVATAASLRTFMALPAAQRSSVILMDVLGYSLDEIGSVTEMTIPAIKASLHRGRARLRTLAQEADDAPQPILREPERSLLAAYVDRFNARDFDALRDMLAEEVKLELVNRSRLAGKEVGRYFTNYETCPEWRLMSGLVEGRPAVLVRREGEAAIAYFILLSWIRDRVVTIRDFHYARYVIEGAEVIEL
jgi:RNA polymerase sigma-70 factor (ECF subfamily)